MQMISTMQSVVFDYLPTTLVTNLKINLKMNI